MGDINCAVRVLHDCTVSKFSFSEWDATDMATRRIENGRGWQMGGQRVVESRRPPPNGSF